jgi:hypothetical protein
MQQPYAERRVGLFEGMRAETGVTYDRNVAGERPSFQLLCRETVSAS